MLNQRKRKYSRIPFDRTVNLDFFTDWYNDCQIENLSLTGMFVSGSFRQHVGEHVLINLVNKGRSFELCIQASGKIVRTADKGIALEFTSMTFESYMYLQMTLLYEAEQPLVIGLELPENCPFEISEKVVSIPENYHALQILAL